MEPVLATVRAERSGSAYTATAQAVEVVVAAVRDARGEHNVTFEISRDGHDARILVAIEDAEAFVGLVEGSSVFELADQRRVGSPPRRFVIGAQPTHIDAEFCVALDDAAAVVRGWLEGSEAPAVGRWVKR